MFGRTNRRYPDTVETIEKELKIRAEYDDELEMLKKYF